VNFVVVLSYNSKLYQYCSTVLTKVKVAESTVPYPCELVTLQ
jgi:hypothetical protein